MKSIDKSTDLYVTCFGLPRIMDKDNNIVVLKNQKVTDLFYYLFHHGCNPVSKDLLLEDLFSHLELSDAQTSFHSTLYQLRKELVNYSSCNKICYEGGSYFFKKYISSDLEKLSELLELEPSDSRAVEILKLYKGKYFERNCYSWSIQTQQRIHGDVIYWISVGLKEFKFTSLVTNQIVAAFPEDCLGNYRILNQIFKNYEEQRELFLIKKLFVLADNYWKNELGLDLPKINIDNKI